MLKPLDANTEVQVSTRGAQRVRQGHLWVYAGDIEHEAKDPEAPIVRVLDRGGNVLGCAFHSAHSQIRLRILVRGDGIPDAAFFRTRLEASIARRAQTRERSATRLVFGEADLLPSIVVDRYNDYLVLQTLSRGADQIKDFLVEELGRLLDPRAIIERNDVKARLLEGLDEKRGALVGDIPHLLMISEGGVRFQVDLAAGQKTGFFLDQSDNRLAAERHAHGRALDCFTNTGAFALHFARRCSSVLAVDTSRDSLALAQTNAELNEMPNVRFHEANVFDFLRELERTGEKFDTICLDPPAFAKNRAAIAGAKAGYKEINLRAIRLLNPEGILVTSSCSYHLSEMDFVDLVQDAARDAHRYIQIVERRSQAEDHPVLASMPETHYLKCLIVRAL
jgi:23S rRNA (cytosine1962-C5)-methyltransferase